MRSTYTYDALGRRIEKKDLVTSSNTRRYYYNNNWQVLCEYDGSNTFKYSFAYGNYIDEVLLISTANTGITSIKSYAYDHPYSPVALIRGC
ncbi:MAG: hypothetical protein ACYTEQ_15100 [Planctomycetota bacterium]|jgi:hypothetical protein